MQYSAETTHIREYLGEIKTKFENILGSVTQGGLIGEKPESRKSRDNIP
jgi:hypothetical protein